MTQAHKKKQLHNMPTESLLSSMIGLDLLCTLRHSAAPNIYTPLPHDGWHGTARHGTGGLPPPPL